MSQESSKKFKPFVPAETELKEFTFKAVFLGVLMALVLGAANAYLGMKAGLTVAATFPAAVVAMAALRPFRGTILEENLARTTASVGEALAAGAIFTIPAFVISGVWDSLWSVPRYLEATAIMLVGGVLGVLFVTVLRRTLVVEAELPFPESVAASEIVKAGQAGSSGAGLVFGAMGIAGFFELFKNSNGIHAIKDSVSGFYKLAKSKIDLLGTEKLFEGGMFIESPSASPALMGVGFIVGPKISAVLFAGAMMGWLLLVPLAVFLNPDLAQLAAGGSAWSDIADTVWKNQIRPLAVGTMIVAAFHTLYKLRKSLVRGIGKAVEDLGQLKAQTGTVSRLNIDLDFKKVGIAIAILAIPLFFLYYHFAESLPGAILLTIVLMILGFLFAAVAGYLVGLIGSSNNPISGLTLSTLLISAVLLVALGVTGAKGVAAVLGVAGVICCAAGIAGDMMQDLKVGHILGGTPRKMQKAELIGVVFASLFLVIPMGAMMRVYDIGSSELPAPQAGLMALLAQGIVGGEMAWSLVLMGMLFAIALIIIGAPSPMLIAVGMYLPFFSTSAIFVGGLIAGIFGWMLKRRKASEEESEGAKNKGVLLASGFVAGESLMAVILAFIVLGLDLRKSTFKLADLVPFEASPWLALIIFGVVAYMFLKLTFKSSDSGQPGSTP